ncbi:MAG: TaqI-like C-terminal specificity domain-containing protein [Dehalococcoidia bacterium]
MEYHWEGGTKIRTEFTPARRWSFLVGKNESSHTAQSQLVPILQDDARDPTIKQLEDAFNIEKVTKEFFEKYRDLFHDVDEELKKIISEYETVREDFAANGIDTVNFAKKLLGQVVFLYFLQKKGWLGVPEDGRWGDGDRRFLRTLFHRAADKGDNFFNDYLEYLFYDALAKEERGTVDPAYYPRFYCKIPFLNGGLFDPLNNYDWVDTDILLDNALFSNTEKTKEGDIGTGILDVFDRYNFTVKEDEPLEKDVAVDPEMLGKVFENLLEVKDRKSRGTYYTPREIVHYMCQESLINYLDTAINTGEVPLVATPPPQGKFFGKPDPEQAALKIPGHRGIVPHQDIEALVRRGELAVEHDARVENTGRETRDYSYKLPQAVRWNAGLIDEKLAGIRVCDPAIGSGAFPVGLMTDIVRARNTLTTYLPDKEGRTNYNFKRHAIQNCLYGVDIDPGAVEIAKLRLWLSLVVDEEDIKQIQPLPNLDYKIVCGNSLLGYPYMPSWTKEIEESKQRVFGETNAKMKQQLKNQIDSQLKDFLANSQRSLGYMVDFDFKIFFSEVFDEKGGFDVAIANPPYIRQEAIKDQKPALQKQSYEVYNSTSDLYTYFYERSYQILSPGGHLCFISSNKWMRAKYGEKLRTFFKDRTTIKQIIDFDGYKVFDATVDTNVLLFQKSKPTDNTINVLNIRSDFDKDIDITNYFRSHKLLIKQSVLDTRCFAFGDETVITLKAKMEKIGTPLKDWDFRIYRGVITGFNEAFIMDNETKENLCRQDSRSIEVFKPVLRGRDIRRHKYEWAGLWLIKIESGWTDRNRGKEDPEGFFNESYPAIYRYLKDIGDKVERGEIKAKGKGLFHRDDQGHYWWELRDCDYYDEFEKEKLIYRDVGDRLSFAYEHGEFYGNNTLYFVNTGSKFLLAVLNSSLLNFYYAGIASQLGDAASRGFAIFIEQLPVPRIPGNQQQPFINLVDQILAIIKDKDYLSNPAKQAEVKELERQIDQMVYQLYDLTQEEIAVVEGSSGR